MQNKSAQEFHIQTQNSYGYKFMKNEHFVHYNDEIKKVSQSRAIEKNGKVVKLPKAALLDNVTLGETLRNRNSRRDYNKGPISLGELSTVLYYSNGLKPIEGTNTFNKFTPTSGGMMSVDIFPIVLNVDTVENGIYYYNYLKHELIEVSLGSYHTWLDQEVFFQSEWTDASVIFALTSSFGKLSKKYGQRAYRLSLLDTGLVAQNVYLLCSALNLKVCACGGYVDEVLDEALQIDGYEVSTFLTTVIGK